MESQKIARHNAEVDEVRMNKQLAEYSEMVSKPRVRTRVRTKTKTQRYDF